ncbi:hypothetical protein JW872_02175 [Candidatus Babeliales bacterium]|nr:hypothetical protein [Candidatus Babeliales bacterium]
MKPFRILVVLLSFALYAHDQIEVGSVSAQVNEKMGIVLALIDPTGELQKVGNVVKQDLEFSNQFDVKIKKVSQVTEAEQIAEWFKKGTPFVVYLTKEDGVYSWRLYDTADVSMIQGKKVDQRGNSPRGWAHAISDGIWHSLMGIQGSFSTKLVYGKGLQKRGKQSKKYLYVRDAADTAGYTETKLVSYPTISVSPRWNRDTKRPLVLYSEYTPTNVRLIAVDMERKRRLVSDFQGVNMQAAYAPDGTEVVYCLSRAPQKTMPQHFTSQLYHYVYDKNKDRSVFKRLTLNSDNNFAPCWGPGKSIFYASDSFSKKAPDICWLDIQAQKITWVTQGKYAVSPDYCAVNNKLAYCKMIDGLMQVFVYDLTSNMHKQVTFDATNKEDCSWSPCGTFLAYSSEAGGRSRIACYNSLTQEQRFITAAHEDCSYPAWSPAYELFPEVVESSRQKKTAIV